jgi:hypothetical protein
MKVRVIYNDKCGCHVEFNNVMSIMTTQYQFVLAIEHNTPIQNYVEFKRIDKKYVKYIKVVGE